MARESIFDHVQGCSNADCFGECLVEQRRKEAAVGRAMKALEEEKKALARRTCTCESKGIGRPKFHAECRVHGPVSPPGYTTSAQSQDLVNPKHYNETGPVVTVPVEDLEDRTEDWVQYRIKAIDVFRRIKDPRLATAFKYIWRVAFGGKKIKGDTRTQEEIDKRDIESAIWYLQDWVDNR